jgi:ClpP class serine protease
MSKMYQDLGMKVTEITAGKYKRIVSNAKPLDEAGEKVLIEQADYIYGIFVNSVAGFRGVTPEKLLESSDGKVFIGDQAIDAGLVDGYTEEKLMNIEELKANHSALYAEIFELGKADGVLTENNRVSQLIELHTPDTAKIIEAAICDPKVEVAEVAMDIAKQAVEANKITKTAPASIQDLQRAEDVDPNKVVVQEEKERQDFMKNALAGAMARLEVK